MTISSYLFLLVTAFLFLPNARAETHMVGENDGWTLNSDYTNWAQGKSFHVGDTLLFNYEEELHNVVEVNASAYEECIKEPNLGVFASGKDSLSLETVGQIWYICGVGDHCENGQKLSINVLP